MNKALQQARDALDKLAKLGNGDRDGNSIGNDIAIKARDALDAELAKPEPSESEAIKAAVLQERENNIALKKILAIVCAYLPPDGISVALAMAEIIAIVDPGTAAKEIPPSATNEKPNEH